MHAEKYAEVIPQKNYTISCDFLQVIYTICWFLMMTIKKITVPHGTVKKFDYEIDK